MDEVRKARTSVPVASLRFGENLGGLVVTLSHDVATLGRQADNDYVVPDPGISRVHAQLRREASSIIVNDLGSSTGTRVNEQIISGARVLRHGDRVAFGPVTAVFEDPASVAQLDDSTQVFGVPQIQSGPQLSPRQQQVVELLAEGMTNAQIGTQLGITERTVKAYAQELYDKLGVRNRAGAVAAAWYSGLIGEGDARSLR